MLAEIMMFVAFPRRYLQNIIAIAATLFGGFLTAEGQTTTALWKVASGNWSIPSNWDCGPALPTGCIPNANMEVGIRNGGAVFLDVNAVAKSTDIGAGALNVGAGRNFIAGGMGIGGVRQGTFTIEAGGVVESKGVFVNPSGMVNVRGSGSNWKTAFVQVGVGTGGSGGQEP
jgi:hypothetical protein